MPTAQLALNSRENSAIKMSPFYLEHGYHPEPLQVREPLAESLPLHRRAIDAREFLS